MAAKYIESSPTTQYPKQLPYIGCGWHQLRTIFQHTTGQKLIKKFPWFVGPRKLASLCKKYSLSALKRKRWTIESLRAIIDKWSIPILLIGRGYNNFRSWGFNPIKAIICQHYISVRWYDDEKETFYCYDSTVKPKENNLPIGNKSLSYTMLKRSRARGGLGIYKKFFIETSK